MAVIGIDIGTIGAKSTIFDDGGNVCGYAYKEYNLEVRDLGYYEINPTVIKETVKGVIAEAVKKYNNNNIKAICATSFGESMVFVDENDAVLCNSLIYMDKRGAEQCLRIEDKFTKAKIAQITGLLPHAMYSAGKMMWFNENEYNIFKRIKKCFFIADYILYTLGGEHYTDYSLASRSMAFDVLNKKWWNEMLAYIGIDERTLPKPVPTGSIVGTISSDIALETGLPQGVKLVIGGHDQITNALGAGVLEAGSAVNVIGAVDCITPAFSMNETNVSLAKYNFPCVPYINNELYVTYAFNMTGGSLLKWFRDNFSIDLVAAAKKTGVSAYDLLGNSMPSKPTNILVLPHFSGTGTPYMDVSSKGAILGLSFDVNRGQMYRALLEGEAYEMNLNLGCLEASGVTIDELRTVGGGSRSDLWMQIRADIMRRKVVCLNVEEAGTLGSAMLAGIATGVYTNLKEARNALVKIKKVYYPDINNGKIYKENYKKYKKLYKKVREVLL